MTAQQVNLGGELGDAEGDVLFGGEPLSEDLSLVEVLPRPCQRPVALQVWTAAAADETLRSQIVPLERKFARGVHMVAVQLLHADDSDPFTHTMIQATLDLARGLGLADVLTDDSRRRTRIARAWAAQLTSIATL